jgi:hypothetical protein
MERLNIVNNKEKKRNILQTGSYLVNDKSTYMEGKIADVQSILAHSRWMLLLFVSLTRLLLHEKKKR